MSTIRLTMAQALVKYLAAQRIDINGQEVALFEECLRFLVMATWRA